MKFNYQARTKKGDVHTGFVEASSKESVVTILRERGLYVTFLEEATAPVYARRIEFFGRITKKDIVLFSRQLAIMFRSRVPLIESLRVLSVQTKNVDFKEKILKISEEVEGGTAFSQALARYPKIFSLFYVAMVKSGEASGKLSEVLNYLADHLEREYHLTAKARGALIYPCLVIIVGLLVLTLLIFFVLPSLIEIFETSGQSFPTSTKIIIALANFFRSWWWLIFLLIILLILFFFKYRSTEAGRNFFDRIFLKIPILGLFLQMIYISRFAENLSTLISSGLPIVQALEIVGDIIGNVSYKEVIIRTREEVKKGEMISSTLSRFPELFPPIFIQMVLIGERTGTLDTSLMYIVDFYQKEVDRTMDNILVILEPALIVFLGFIVAGIMLSILMPLYQTIAL